MAEHVVIVGGGIAGTAAALALRTAGIAVTVLDARPADDDSGAVVRINPNGMDALRAVNAHQTILAGSFPLVRTERIGADGARVGYALAADPASDRGLPRVLHWSQLAARLRAVARDRGAVFRHGVRVCDVHESGGDASGGPVTAVLEGGQTVHGDVLVGADGVHSLVRRRIDAEAPAPQRLGTRTVYGFAADPPREPPPPEVLRSYLGPKAFLAATRDSLSGGACAPSCCRGSPKGRSRPIWCGPPSASCPSTTTPSTTCRGGRPAGRCSSATPCTWLLPPRSRVPHWPSRTASNSPGA
ncbi:hypothetical protein ACZ91_19650, partial [Streptomyces regensis]